MHKCHFPKGSKEERERKEKIEEKGAKRKHGVGGVHTELEKVRGNIEGMPIGEGKGE